MRIVLMGPPGAGKGTQAVVVAARLRIPHISTGEIFRANVSAGTDLGREATRYMNSGEYVPDEITNAMVDDRLTEPDTVEGFLLDGFPRTVEQVAALDEMLASRGQRIDRVAEITADTDEIVGRLLQRALDQGRADDTEDVIRRRMEVYREQTEPLTRIYDERGVLVRVDGMGSVDEVSARLLDALAR